MKRIYNRIAYTEGFKPIFINKGKVIPEKDLKEIWGDDWINIIDFDKWSKNGIYYTLDEVIKITEEKYKNDRKRS